MPRFKRLSDKLLPTNDEDLLSPIEVAYACGIHVDTLPRYRRLGCVPDYDLKWGSHGVWRWGTMKEFVLRVRSVGLLEKSGRRGHQVRSIAASVWPHLSANAKKAAA